jgi:cytoskeletal protein RodZ
MAASFGQQLRLAREARGITLKEISEQTRISTQYLEAIEKDNYKILPGGIFNRSFVKAYARSVGFDEGEAIEAYKRIAREQGHETEDPAVTPQKFQVLSHENTRSPLVTALLTIIILLIVSLGIYAGLHWYLNSASKEPSNNQPATPNNSAKSTTPNETTQTTSSTNQTADPNAFTIQIKAKENVWLKIFNDGEKNSSYAGELAQGATQEVKPQQQIRIQVAKDKAGALEITVNGRPINAQFQDVPKVSLAQVIITKEGYKQILAQ